MSELKPSIHTDAYEDDEQHRIPIIFLAGPVKHWWSCFGSEEHKRYVKHRESVRSQLIDAGYLTYVAWDALKGSWDPRAQSINNAAIGAADLMIILTPPEIPAHGTDEEEAYAALCGTPVTHYPPGSVNTLLSVVHKFVGAGLIWWD